MKRLKKLIAVALLSVNNMTITYCKWTEFDSEMNDLKGYIKG